MSVKANKKGTRTLFTITETKYLLNFMNFVGIATRYGHYGGMTQLEGSSVQRWFPLTPVRSTYVRALMRTATVFMNFVN